MGGLGALCSGGRGGLLFLRFASVSRFIFLVYVVIGLFSI